VAGFPLPVLRYVVGSGGSELSESRSPDELRLILPGETDTVKVGKAIDFVWTAIARVAAYRIDVEAENGGLILGALVPSGLGVYRAPPWLAERAGAAKLRWRVVGLDLAGSSVAHSPWRVLSVGGTP
jgi:hypothetical protein